MSDYYVNPESESVLELGTLLHPYKNINILFRDLFEFGSQTNLNITVHLLLSTEHYLSHSDLFLYNMTNITFQPYQTSDNSTSEITDSDLKTTVYIINSGEDTGA